MFLVLFSCKFHDKSVKRIPSKLSKPRVLLSCAGGYGAENLYENFLQSELSKEVEFVGCHCDPYLLPRSSFSENYLVPYAKDTVKYIEAIKSIINKENIELFVPKSCKEISVVSKVRQELGCQVYLPDHSEITIAQDKYSFYQTVSKFGVSTAETYQVSDINSISEIIAKLVPVDDKYWVRLKTAGLAGAAGAAAVENADQATKWIETFTTNSGYPLTDFTISEYLPGKLYEVLLYFRANELSVAKVYKNIRYSGANSSGAGSTPEVAVTSNEPEAIKAIEESVKAVKAISAAASSKSKSVYHLSVKYGKDDNPCVTEVNIGRFPSTCAFFDRTGIVNVSELFFEDALDSPKNSDPRNFYDLVEKPIYMIRSLDKAPTFIDASQMTSSYDKVGV